MKTGYFQKVNTFVGLVFDARYNYEFSVKYRNEIFNGYFHYILPKLGQKVDKIYLAGYSICGCLAMRLASKLETKFRFTKIIVHNLDGVCALGEFGVTISLPIPFHFSPDGGDRKLLTTNITKQFKHKECLAIHSFMSGSEVVGIAFVSNLVRAFDHLRFVLSSDFKNEVVVNVLRNYYEKSWSPYGHLSIADEEDMHYKVIDH